MQRDYRRRNMPIRKSSLIKKEKKNIITDIIFDDIIPNSNPETYWGLDMLTAEIRKYNIDEQLHINKIDVKRTLSILAKKRKDIELHLINNNLYFRFFS